MPAGLWFASVLAAGVPAELGVPAACPGVETAPLTAAVAASPGAVAAAALNAARRSEAKPFTGRVSSCVH